MPPIEPAELSAFLDGELPTGRAEEVRAALARDPVLRRAYERLVARDADWRTCAEAAMFRPRVHLAPVPVAGRVLAATAVVLTLLLLRLALKSLPPLYEAGFETLLLTLVVVWGLRRLVRATNADRLQLALAPDS